MNEKEKEQEILRRLVSKCNAADRQAKHEFIEGAWAYCKLFATEADGFNRLAERLSQPHIEIVVRATAKYLSGRTEGVLGFEPDGAFLTSIEDRYAESLVSKEFMRALVQKFGNADDIELASKVAPPHVHVPVPLSLAKLNPPGPAETGMTPETAGRSWELSTEALFQDYLYDVNLSYSHQDIEAVRKLVTWFKANDIRVWFYEEQVQAGDDILEKLNHGTGHARVHVHCVSANHDGLGTLYTPDSKFGFYVPKKIPGLPEPDPPEDVERNICVRLDDTPIKGPLSGYPCFLWTATARDDAKLLEICRSKRARLSPEQLQARERVKVRELANGKTPFVHSVAWSPDELRVLIGLSDGPILLWDVATSRYLRILEGHTGDVDSVAWSPDGQHVLSGAGDDVARLWDITTGRCLREFKGHDGTRDSGVKRVAWSPDGRYALSGAKDHTIRLWEIASGRCLRVFEGHTGGVHDVAWSPDGLCALSGSEDKTIRLWEIASDRCLCIFEGHTESVRSVAWSPDGKRFLSGSSDQRVRLWDVTSGRCLVMFRGHDEEVNGVAWSPDGHRILSEDMATIRLWDVASGRCLHVLSVSVFFKRSVRWSPGRLRVLSASLEAALCSCNLDSLA